jgi:hypothetical protein
MRNKLFSLIVCCILGLGVSITGCDNGNSTSNKNLIIESLLAFSSTAKIELESETNFAVGERIFLYMIVYNPGLDIEMINITLTQVGGYSKSVDYPINSMPSGRGILGIGDIEFEAGDEGVWVISAYAKGNMSNTASLVITVQ